jgi:hypothetical protein
MNHLATRTNDEFAGHGDRLASPIQGARSSDGDHPLSTTPSTPCPGIMSNVADTGPESLIAALVEADPGLGPVLHEHMETHGELLSHVLFGDVTRFILAAVARGDDTSVSQLLDLLDAGLDSGDPDVVELVVASFVENVGVWEPTMDSFVATWPKHLGRKRNGRDGALRVSNNRPLQRTSVLWRPTRIDGR